MTEAAQLGKPYKTELARIPGTYGDAVEESLSPEAIQAVQQLGRGPMLAVGSGGSFTAAHYAARLHEQLRSQPARALSPLALTTIADLREYGVVIFSAGGRNPDVLAAYKHAIQCEARVVVILTRQPKSPLAALAGRDSIATVVNFAAGPEKDGYLATNTLLASIICIHRLYGGPTLPPNISQIDAVWAELRTNSKSWSPVEFQVVLHGAGGATAAIDFESRCSEAGLAAVQIADFRNFAHGRHYWLERHSSNTCVVTFESSEDAQLAEKTLACLPPSIPRLRVVNWLPESLAGLALVLQSIGLAGITADRHQLDPGRPRVPAWGRNLYHLRAKYPLSRVLPTRKKFPPGEEKRWGQLRRNAIRMMAQNQIMGLALDYDGTIVHVDHRFGPISKTVQTELERLASGGLPIGIATGRGKSAVQQLRTSIPEHCWSTIWVSLYGGGLNQGLADDVPTPGPPGGDLAALEEHLKSAADWKYCRVRANQYRVTVVPEDSRPLAVYWNQLQEHILTNNFQLRVRHSSHSIDVTGPEVSKTAVLRMLHDETGCDPNRVLRIGDQGAWPGNDFDLLDHSLGLTVDVPSSNPNHCWDLTPPGLRGPAALHYYLSCLNADRSGKNWTLTLPVPKSG